MNFENTPPIEYDDVCMFDIGPSTVSIQHRNVNALDNDGNILYSQLVDIPAYQAEDAVKILNQYLKAK